jgi:hypothetical protein
VGGGAAARRCPYSDLAIGGVQLVLLCIVRLWARARGRRRGARRRGGARGGRGAAAAAARARARGGHAWSITSITRFLRITLIH